MIDVHTHVLPKMDDGSKSTAESIMMLRYIQKAGIETVIATPHFYAHKESMKRFLVRREKAEARLSEAMEAYSSRSLPKVVLGAEVAYFSGISTCEGLEKLTIYGTDILMVELPFVKWDSEIIREIQEVQNRRKLRVMLAHIERYWSIYENRKYIKELLESDVLIQVSTGALYQWRMCRMVVKWGQQGYIDAFGSDAHNMRTRKPDWDRSLPIIEKKGITTSIEYLIGC